jgi:hypothetical protein
MSAPDYDAPPPVFESDDNGMRGATEEDDSDR